MPAYYPAGYAEMKQAAAIFAKENFGPFKREKTIDDATGKEGIFYEVEDCQEPFESTEINTGGDPTQLALEALAREIAKREHYLSELYSPAVYQEPLRDYERKSIKHLSKAPPPPKGDDVESPEYQRYSEWASQGEKLMEALAVELEKRRQRLEPNSIPVSVGGGCGAGEVAYLVKTEPADGRLWITTKFSFDLCRARKLDPWNTGACRWTELSPTEPAYLSGRYVYQARWRNGKRQSGIRSFDGLLDAEKGDEIHVVIKAT